MITKPVSNNERPIKVEKSQTLLIGSFINPLSSNKAVTKLN